MTNQPSGSTTQATNRSTFKQLSTKMPFNRKEVSALFVKCHRRCCICHRFCGIKMETDHIVPIADGGGDNIDNAIPVCLECHAEIHCYNDKHPRGRKFQTDELKGHKEQWLTLCESPEIFGSTIRDADVGPLQALVDELDFNETVAQEGDFHKQGCKFQERQFLRAIHEGSVSLLKDSIKKPLLEAYREMGAANSAIEGKFTLNTSSASNAALQRIANASQRITVVRDELLKFLSSDA